MPPSTSSTTLFGNECPTTVPLKPTRTTLSGCRTLKNLTKTSLRTRIRRQLTKIAHVRPVAAAPILSTTLAFILLRDLHAMAVINPLITNNVSDTFWSKLWIQSTGQPAAPACTSSLRVASPSSNLCALASATDASTLAATLKHWLLFGCTHRWPHGEPLVPLDVIVQVHERLHKYVTCAQVQGAVEKRLTRTQAADFTLVAAYVRGMVAIWPARVTEIAGGWALVVTRVETELDKVDGDVGVEERRRVRNMCWEVFRAVVDVGVYDKFSSGKCT